MWPARVKSHSPRQRRSGEAAGLATEAAVPIRSLPGQGRGLPCCNGTGEMLGVASSWSVLERTSRDALPGRSLPFQQELEKNLKMMLQTPESGDNPQPPHMPAASGRWIAQLSLGVQHWPSIQDGCFFPPKLWDFHPHSPFL